MKLFNTILFAVVRVLSHLPARVLYVFADMLQWLMYSVIRYRRDVVIENISRSFPQMSKADVLKTAKRFYRNFADVMVELMRLRTMTKEEAASVVTFKNIELLQSYFDQGRSVVAVSGHVGNWEWLGGMAFSVHTPFNVVVAAKPQKNTGFSDYILNIRRRFGADVVNFKMTYKAVLKSKDKPTLTLLVADQSPMKSEIEFRTTFMHQDTPVFLGAEKIAVNLKCPVVYIDMQRTRRGQYIIDVIPVCDDPLSLPATEITKRHVALLEQSLIAHPDNWLWSHKRWKHANN